MYRAMIAVGLCTVFVSVGSAQEKKSAAPKGGEKGAAMAPAGPPKPSPELITTTKYFVGSWKCDGTMPAGPWGPGGKETTAMSFKMELGDMWMAVEGDMKMADAKMPPMTFRGVNGYDPTTKKFMRMDWDSMGGVAHMSSPGWEADKMVFTGDGMMMGQKTKMRHTMVKKSDTEMTSTFEMAGADGKWMPMGTDVCKKAPGKATK
jgi:hypothetical protein